MKEIWKEIPGYEGYYEVSNFGNIRSVERSVITLNGQTRIYKGYGVFVYTNDLGYKKVCLWKNNKSKTKKVHQLVLQAFVGPCPIGYVCRHFPDRNPSNNKLENLSWGTKEQNQGPDRVAHGTSNQGERCGSAKLTQDQALEIKQSNKCKKIDFLEMANKFNVSITTIYDIKMGRTWRHI